MAIKNALAKLDITYALTSFLRDLSWIRRQTLTKYTIKKAFKKSGIYPPNCEKCLKNLKTFTPPKSVEEPSLPTAPRTLKKPHHVADASYEWEDKMNNLLSSDSKPRFESFIRGIRQVIVEASFQAVELNHLSELRKEQIEAKSTSRKWYHRDGGLTLEEAQRLEDIDKAKTVNKLVNQQQRIVDRLWRTDRDIKYRKGVESRGAERIRKRQLRELFAKGQVIEEGNPLLIQIPDTEAIW